MTTARDVMTADAHCVASDQTAKDAARLMGELGVGAVPICGKDNKVKGVVTDRDLVVKVLDQGRDAASFPAGDLNQNEAITIGADDTVQDVLATMTNHKVRRLPVIDQDRLVGMVALADITRAVPYAETGELVEALSAE
ncbi:CBS domain-containing protein [Sciscionella marina]|uniref:CBS domain-containing protein n=1 Tax=Sciscionella marina TaxID=508770 RepID=UPI0004778E61|nr:CBS domain-containing protein [Sciscionella marina]